MSLLPNLYNNSDSPLWKKIEWKPSSKQLKQFLDLQKILTKLNSQVNLTRLIKDEDYWINQVFDSLWPLKKELRDSSTPLNCIDVGTGCGFPGLAVAIALPKAKITLVDAISRKTNAIQQIVNQLGLSTRINVRTERIEQTGHNPSFRSNFDLAIARAVGSAPVLAEYLIPLINYQGNALLYRGKWNNSNEAELRQALRSLNAEINMIEAFELPFNRGIRHQIRLKSIDLCPKNYPRAIGIATKRPLGLKNSPASE